MVRTVSQKRRNEDASHGRDRRAIHAGRRRLHGSVRQRQMALADGTPGEAEAQAASIAGEDERGAKGRSAFGIADERQRRDARGTYLECADSAALMSTPAGLPRRGPRVCGDLSPQDWRRRSPSGRDKSRPGKAVTSHRTPKSYCCPLLAIFLLALP